MRPARKVKVRINYRELHNGKRNTMAGVEEGQISGDELDMSCSSHDEETDYMNMTEQEFDDEVQSAMADEDEGKLEMLFKTKEKRCKKLQNELNKSTREEKARKKRLREWEEKFKKLNKTEQSLNKSLASSRNNSPLGSPKKAGKKTGAVQKKTGTHKSKFNFNSTAEQRGECFQNTEIKGENEIDNAELLNMLVSLKQGNSTHFSELLNKSREASDNFEFLKRDRNRAGANNNDTGSSELKGEKKGNNTGVRSVEHDKCDDVSGPDGISQLVEKLRIIKQKNECMSVQETSITETGKLVQAINTLVEKLDERRKGDYKILGDKEGKKKLVSGKTTKPDESDIKKQIKFAHEKLDPRHVKERVFDKLTASLLVAGELELAAQPNISEEERLARINIAKTVCYHKKYLQDEDLREGYDTILKKVEQGTAEWSRMLSEELHLFYDYRANAILREKSGGLTAGKQKGKTENNETETAEGDEDKDAGKVIYCLDYNLNKCSHDKSHKGKWKGKQGVWKWHVCKTCLRSGELNHHRDGDTKCPNKA